MNSWICLFAIGIFLRSSHLSRLHLSRKEVKNESLTYSRTVVGGGTVLYELEYSPDPNFARNVN